MNDDAALPREDDMPYTLLSASSLVQLACACACCAYVCGASARAQSSPLFAELQRFRMPALVEWATCALAVDVEGDGDLDLFLGNTPGSRLYLNDGHGRFRDASATHLPSPSPYQLSVGSGDLDGDGDVDLVIGNQSFSGPSNRLWLNDGSGRFRDETTGRLPTDSDMTWSLAVGDVDRDGDLDLVAGNAWTYGYANRLYLNDGSAHFTDATASRLPGAREWTNAVVLSDLDGDADLDLLVGNTGQSRFLRNDGRGFFADDTPASLPLVSHDTRAFGAADFDGDGDYDLLLVNASLWPAGEPDALYLNDGAGRFAEAPSGFLPPDAEPGVSIAIADVDLDGDLDFATGNVPNPNTGIGGQNRLYLNNGHAQFVDATRENLPVSALNTYGLVLADLDGDRDPDLFEANGIWDPDKLLFNLRSHVHAPQVPQLGSPYRLDFYARGAPPTFHIVLPLLGISEAHIPLPPFGTLQLDPRSTILLPPLYLAPPGGPTSLAGNLPAEPGHLGTLLACQALVFDPLGPARLSNLAAESIR